MRKLLNIASEVKDERFFCIKMQNNLNCDYREKKEKYIYRIHKYLNARINIPENNFSSIFNLVT